MSTPSRKGKREIRPSIPNKIVDPEDMGPFKDGPYFLVTYEEKDYMLKVPFLLNTGDEYVDPNVFTRLIVFNQKFRCFSIIKIEAQNEFSFSNTAGHLKIRFDDHTYSVNKKMVIKKESNYIEDRNTVSVALAFDLKSGSLPKYYNENYPYLIPTNFLIDRDQAYVYPDSDSKVTFKGVVTRSEPEVKAPSSLRNEGENLRFFTFTQSYLIFEASNISYAVPTKVNMTCLYDPKEYILYCKDGTLNYSYKFEKGYLCFGELEALTINVIRFRIIVGKKVQDVVDVAVARLNGLFPPMVGDSAQGQEGGDGGEENEVKRIISGVTETPAIGGALGG